MKRIKIYQIRIILLAIFLSNNIYAQEIETSHKEIPYWIKGIVRGFIIGEGTGETFIEAKEDAMRSVTSQMLRTIAQSPEIVNKMNLKNININNDLNSEESFESVYVENIYPLVLNGVSINFADDYYWIWEKNRKNDVIRYYIKYPFQEIQLHELISNYKRIDQLVSERLDTLLNYDKNYKDVESIIRDYKEIDNLEPILLGERKYDARILKERLRTLISSIRIAPISNKLGCISYDLVLDNKIIKTYSEPRITSNCLASYTFNKDGDLNIVHYDYSSCKDQAQNSLTIIYEFLSERVAMKFDFNVSDNRMSVMMKSPIIVLARKSYYDVTEARYVFKLYSQFDGPFIVEKIVITPIRSWKSFWTGSQNSQELPTQYFDNINQRIEGKGVHSVEFLAKCNLDSYNYSSVNYTISCSGNVLCRSLATGEVKSFPFQELEWRSDW